MSQQYSREWWAERLHLIKAFSEGEVIQTCIDGLWKDMETFSWALPASKYRIKPKTVKTKRYWWKNTLNVFAPYVALSTRDECHKIESLEGFGGWIDHDWVELELPTGTKTSG